MCFNFHHNILSQIFLILKIIQQDIVINSHRSSCKIPVVLVRTWIYSLLFEKSSNIRISWELSSGSWVVPCGRTDGQTNRQAGVQAVMRAGRWAGTFHSFVNALKILRVKVIKIVRVKWIYTRWSKFLVLLNLKNFYIYLTFSVLSYVCTHQPDFVNVFCWSYVLRSEPIKIRDCLPLSSLESFFYPYMM